MTLLFFVALTIPFPRVGAERRRIWEIIRYYAYCIPRKDMLK